VHSAGPNTTLADVYAGRKKGASYPLRGADAVRLHFWPPRRRAVRSRTASRRGGAQGPCPSDPTYPNVAGPRLDALRCAVVHPLFD
jgi:hypothetical protein